MKKLILFTIILLTIFTQGFSQSDFPSDDELFGGSSSSFDTNLSDFSDFSDDSLFEDDGIIEVYTTPTDAKSADLSKGILFQTGSVKIGGAFDLGLTTLTSFQKDKDAAKSFEETLLLPKASAQLTIDARPTENLRLYLKTGIHYPYVTESYSTLVTTPTGATPGTGLPSNFVVNGGSNSFNIANIFYIKELFSDFNIGQNVGFRFGKQTVSWGVGYFYSPADVINLTRINPEDPTAQVEGPLALRTQIVFPGTQNAIWAYIIPDNNFAALAQGAGPYLKNTAFALKGDVVLGNFEFGLGAWYKNQNPAKFMLTTTGTIFRTYSIFSELVLSIGKDNVPEDYTPVFQGTLGILKSWTKQNLTIGLQYYYNGQEFSASQNYGHNLAALITFSKFLFSDLSLSLFGQYNFDNNQGTAFCDLKYSPIKEFSVTAGPYFTFTKDDVITSIKLVFNLGCGKF